MKRALLLSLLAALAYAGSIPSGYVLDDYFAIETNPVVRGEVPLHEAFTRDFWGRPAAETIGTYRPLAVLSLALDTQLTGGRPWVSHLLNVLLHALCVAVVYLTWRHLVGEPVALVGAALFSVLAAPAEAVQALVGRADLLSTLAGVAMLHAHRRRNIAGAIGALGAFAVAVGSKESAIAFPVLLLSADWLLPPEGGSRRPRWWLAGGYAVVVALVGTGRLVAIGSWNPVIEPVLNPLAGAPLLGRFFGAARIIGERYLLGIVDPTRRLFLCSAPACGPDSPASLWAWSGLAALIGLGAVALASVRRAPPLAFSLVWFLAFFGLVSNLLVLSPSVYAERLLYAPLVGLSMAATWGARGLGKWLGRPTLGWALVGVVGLGNLVALQFRHDDWRDPESLYRTGLTYAPDSSMVRGLVAQVHMEKGELEEALVHARLAASLSPQSARAHETLAIILDRSGRTEEARRSYLRLLELERSERALRNYALFLSRHGQALEGAALLRQLPQPSPLVKETITYLEEMGRTAPIGPP